MRIKLKVTKREFAHILQGLRLIQKACNEGGIVIDPWLGSITDEVGDMTSAELDELCERLNCPGK